MELPLGACMLARRSTSAATSGLERLMVPEQDKKIGFLIYLQKPQDPPSRDIQGYYKDAGSPQLKEAIEICLPVGRPR